MDREDQAPDEKGAVPSNDPLSKDALSGVDRAINSSDLNHPGVQKLVLDRLDKSEHRAKQVDSLKDELHDAKLELAVAQSTLKRIESLDNMQAAMLGVGCLFLGLIPTAFPIHLGLAAIVTIAGGTLVWSSIASKKKDRNGS